MNICLTYNHNPLKGRLLPGGVRRWDAAARGADPLRRLRLREHQPTGRLCASAAAERAPLWRHRPTRLASNTTAGRGIPKLFVPNSGVAIASTDRELRTSNIRL